MKINKFGLIGFLIAAVFMAGQPRQALALNEIAGTCQLPASYMTETGLKRLVRTGVAAIATAALNPFDDFTTRQKKKIQKAATMLGVGVTLMTLCPPLVVPEGFSDLPREGRVDYAVENNFDPIDIAELNFDVDNPADPASCSKGLSVTLNGAGRMQEGGDFPELEFVYVEPFGSFPSAVELYDEVAERVRELVESAFNDILPNLEPVEDLISGIEDFTNTIDSFLSSLGVNFTLADLIPDIDDYILDLIGLAIAPNCDSVGLECEFRTRFADDFGDDWRTDLLELRDAGVITPTPGGFAFPDGPSVVQFRSDIDTGFSTEIRYDQDLFVKEYFEPEFDVLFTEADPEGGPDLNIIAEFIFEALEPGQADTSFTPPNFQQGSISVTDNCDPQPELIGGFGREIPIGGPYYPRISASDRALNITGRPESDPFCNGVATDPSDPDPRCKKYAIKVMVVDTIPPDVKPVDPIGIPVANGLTQVLFTDSGIGCTEFNCQQLRPDAQLFPPPVFDFATIAPAYECFASNSFAVDKPCDAPAMLPVGETTTVRWVSTDPDGNSAETTQLAALREIDTNQSPSALGTTVTIAANTPTLIGLLASDPEFDPISFAVRSLPANGSLTVTPDPEFQTRFSASGTISNLTDAIRVRSNLDNNRTADIVADPDGRRVVALDETIANGNPGILDALYFDTLVPDSLTLGTGDYSLGDLIFADSNTSLAEDMLVGDWTSTGGRIHGLVRTPNSKGGSFSPDGGFDISTIADNPAHFELESGFLFITDPDPDNAANGHLHVVQINNAGSGPASWSVQTVRTIDLGFNATGISRVNPQNCVDADAGDPFEYLVADWDNGKIHRLDFGDQASPVLGGDTEPLLQTWDVAARLTDPDGSGPNRPNIFSPRDIGILNGDCRNATDPIHVNVVDDGNKNLDGFSLTFPPAPISASGGLEPAVASEFVQMFAVEALSDSDLVILEADRVSRFDLFGNLMSNIQVYRDPNRGALNGSVNEGLRPLDDSPWAAMDTDGIGNMFLLSFGNPDNEARIEVVKVTVHDGHNNYTEMARQSLQIPEQESSEKGRALAFSPGPMSATSDDVLYAFTDNGLERLNATTLVSAVLFDFSDDSSCQGDAAWCENFNTEFPMLNLMDMDADGMGNLYITDASNQRVHKIADDGTYVGWLGRCDSGVGCDTSLPLSERRSLGFTCNVNDCAVGDGGGYENGQFTFVPEPLDQDKIRPSSGAVKVNPNAAQIYITDNPDDGGGSVPRIQIFDLSGTFVSATVPDGAPGNLLEFLEPGETNTINDISTTPDSLFVIEDLPLKRLHVFDINPFQATVDGASVEYTPSTGFVGNDSFIYTAIDSFGAESSQATVNITVQNDTGPPVISNCPPPLTVEATRTGAAKPATMTPGDTGSAELAWFLEGKSPPYDDPSTDIVVTDDITTPPPVLTVQPGTLFNVFPLNATTPVMFTAFDGAGNFSSCQSSITVQDTIAPVLTVPDDLVVEATGPLTQPDLGTPTVEDIGGATLTTQGIPAGGFAAPLGGRVQPVSILYRAQDAGGNVATGIQTVTVVDTTPPVLTAADMEVAAVNGHSNAYALVPPAATDAVGIDGDVACQPSLSGSVAAVPLGFVCLARDVSGNVGHVGFTYDIVQLNGDGDAFADIVDPAPGVANNDDAFSDVPLGGTTTGTYQAAGGGSFRILDAYLPTQGVRAEWTASDAGDGPNTSVVSLCSDALTVSEFEVVLDEIGEVDVNAASVTCAPAAVRNHLGPVRATWTLPNSAPLSTVLPDSFGLTVDAYMATAAAENAEALGITVANNLATIEPGETLDVQGLANYSPTTTGIDDAVLTEDGAGLVIDLAPAFSDEEDPVDALIFAVTENTNSGLLQSLQIDAAAQTLTLTPAPDAFGQAQVTITATDTQNASGSATFGVTVEPINDPPVLTLEQTLVVVDEDAGPVGVTIAAPLAPGPANEAEQDITVQANNDNSLLYSTQPELSLGGQLTFETYADESGNATVDLLVVDSGGTAMGGVDRTSASVSIVVNPVNDPPTFTLAADPSFATATPMPVTVPGFARDLSPGPADEAGQALLGFTVTALGTGSGVATEVVIDGTGRLDLMLTGAAGSDAYSVTLEDDGGVQNGGRGISDPRVFTVVVTGGDVDMAVAVEALQDVVEAGGELHHVITAMNLGADTVAGSLVVANLPSQLSNGQLGCASPSVCAIDETGTARVTLGPSELTELLLISDVQHAPEELITLGVQIMVPEGLNDVEPGNNAAQASTQMILFADGFER